MMLRKLGEVLLAAAETLGSMVVLIAVATAGYLAIDFIDDRAPIVLVPVAVIAGLLIAFLFFGILFMVGRIIIESMIEGWRTDRRGVFFMLALWALIVTVVVVNTAGRP